VLGRFDALESLLDGAAKAINVAANEKKSKAKKQSVKQ
jgi:hypothetical protein